MYLYAFEDQTLNIEDFIEIKMFITVDPKKTLRGLFLLSSKFNIVIPIN